MTFERLTRWFHGSMSGRWARPSQIAVAAVTALAAVGAALDRQPAHSQAGIGSFQMLGCYYNQPDKNRLWLAAVALNPKYSEESTYQDDSFYIITEAGGVRKEIPGTDVLVHPMKAFNFKGAEKYQFLKYSLVLDYSGSIKEPDLIAYLEVLDWFISRLPLAIEGQVIRFSDQVEKSPFTNNADDIKRQFRQPFSRGYTALHDAVMEGANSLIKEGANIPFRFLIVFTDGFDNKSVQYRDKQNFISTFTNLVKSDRVLVLVIGVSAEQDRALLKSITDVGSGVWGHYFDVPNFHDPRFKQAFQTIEQMINHTVIFRIKKFGPDRGTMKISLTNKAKGSSNHITIQQFDCTY